MDGETLSCQTEVYSKVQIVYIWDPDAWQERDSQLNSMIQQQNGEPID